MKEVIDKVKFSSVKSLTRLVISALENATLQIEAQSMRYTNTQLPPIRQETNHIAESFMHNLNRYFDGLTTLQAKKSDIADYGSLSLVDHDYLEAIIAMEGMVNHARNCDIQQYISFTTRLDTLLPNLHIDETNNPLDPEQIGDSFNEAIRPMGLKAHYLLTIYREFNKAVFHNLEEILSEANETLIKLGVLPKLDIKARNKELQKTKRAASRPTTDAETRAFSDDDEANQKQSNKSNAEMFAMMQTLVKGLSEQQSTQSNLPISAPLVEASSANDLATEQKDLKEQQAQLMSMLTDIQSKLNSQSPEAKLANSNQVTLSINKSLEAASKSGDVTSINSQSSDVINFVTLLYQAIWNDATLPVVMKELIGRTQIPIMKVALGDTTFFDHDQHPGRVILNEFAMAGVAWTEQELIENDPTHSKVSELVEELLAAELVDNDFLQKLINDLRAFKGIQGRSDASLETRIRESDDHSERMDDVNEFVSQKINERILDKNLDPSIRKLLDHQLHEFLVKLVLKEGPGGSSWKPVMSTIDVLLWTVKTQKEAGDKARFDKINPRLLDNLEKALEIGGTSKTKITKIMRQLRQVQDYSYHVAALGGSASARPAASSNSESDSQPTNQPAQKQRKEPPPLPRDDPHLRQVDKLPIGTWFEFQGAAGQPVRCTLAAKIDSIDKLFFVNRQGVKVVELTRMRLARELKVGSVKIVSEGSLIDRAMESVISNLRESAPKAEKEDAVA